MTRKMTLEVSADDDDVAYLILPDHPRDGVAGISRKQILCAICWNMWGLISILILMRVASL